MKSKKTTVKINSEKCKGCMLCIKACPQKAIQPSGKVNKKGQEYVSMAYPERCTGCGLCFIMCPDCAIEIETKELEEK
jgi:2-oxoglutarate ferredoxin oxidoreductase subunit delta